ncbi:hypothetical protein ES705_21463 [subsurface metagenome]
MLSNSIWSLYNDKQGKLWIGTATKGISVIDEKYSKFESFQKNIFDKTSLTDNDVTGFAEDSEGNVWIATDGGGICKFDTKKKHITKTILNSEDVNLLVNNAVQSVLCDTYDNIWVGTWAGGIDRLTKNGRRIRNYKLESEEGRGNNNILVLFAGVNETIWAGTAGSGLFRYDKIEDEFRQVVCMDQTDILTPSAFVSSMLVDMDGRFWIGTLNGLVSLTFKDNGNSECIELVQSDQNEALSSRMIDILFEDSSGRLWFGTSDYGLILFNEFDTSFITFNKQNGLPGNSIKGILEDEEGYLWVTTSKGLCRFNYDSLSFTIFNREDGLNSNEFYIRSCLQTKNGLFFLGGENGFNVFYPKEIKTNDFVPPVYLTSLKINNVSPEIGAKNSPLNKHIGKTSEIILSHKQSSFTIEFVALNYTRSARNQFSCLSLYKDHIELLSKLYLFPSSTWYISK